jgi:nitroreductase
MRKYFIAAGVFIFMLSILPGNNRGAFVLSAQESNPVAAPIVNHYAARNFIAGTIGRQDLETILYAGVRSPSANNRQPWQFTVVQDQNLAKQIVSNIVEGNVLIVISARDGQNNGGMILDCALAAQSIYLTAQVLGYGSRIYTGPIDTVNRRFKSDLGLPNGYSAVALVRVGRVQSGIDAVSAASARKPLNSMVNYK